MSLWCRVYGNARIDSVEELIEALAPAGSDVCI